MIAIRENINEVRQLFTSRPTVAVVENNGICKQETSRQSNVCLAVRVVHADISAS